VSQGYTVSAASLAKGGQDVTSLLTTCERIASDAVSAMGGMAGAAGHAGLEAALLGATEQGTKTFLDIGAAYQHVGVNLDQTADTYATTEQTNTKSITAIRDGAAK
jgi:hypothetical protein